VPEAVADLTKAADAGAAAAQNQLGVLYITGVPGFMSPDVEKGVKRFRQAAAQGNVQAMQNLPRAESDLASQSAAKSNWLREMVRPKRFELPASWFVVAELIL
jgi:TPR repeat protein